MHIYIVCIATDTQKRLEDHTSRQQCVLGLGYFYFYDIFILLCKIFQDIAVQLILQYKLLVGT